MSFKFIHTADWQLGKTFGQFPQDQAGLLREARIAVIGRIAETARKHEVRHVLVAGDVWDSAIPSNRTLRQPLTVMGESSDIMWWLLPGNHDPDGPDGLWDRVEAIAPDNVRVLRKPEAVEVEPGVVLLPAPWRRIQHGQDLTAWMETAQTPKGALRIGLAHGAVKGFGTEGDADREIIPPDRARSAGLDYLALGDWHARTTINSRTHYSGTPEPDRHKSGARGQVLLVTLRSGTEPQVEEVSVAQYDWPILSLPLVPNEMEATLAQLKGQLETGQPLRRTHAELHLSGDVTVADWQAFESELERLRGECASLRLRGEDGINHVIIPEDIAALDAQGAVREAAESLLTRSEDPDLSKSDRDLAKEALQLLLCYGAQDA